jgi:hypothetical protein
MNFMNLINALKAGYELKNSATWKDRQKTISLVVVLLGVLVPFLPKLGVNIVLSQDDIFILASAVSIVLGIINTILTVATSSKIGIGSNKEVKAAEKVTEPVQISTIVRQDVSVVREESVNINPKETSKVGLGVGD